MKPDTPTQLLLNTMQLSNIQELSVINGSDTQSTDIKSIQDKIIIECKAIENILLTETPALINPDIDIDILDYIQNQIAIGFDTGTDKTQDIIKYLILSRIYPKQDKPTIRQQCQFICNFLIAKNQAYGNSALDPVRIFSKADPVEQINVRLDDKLSRLARGHDAGEDVTLDLIGYLILKRIAEKKIINQLNRKNQI